MEECHGDIKLAFIHIGMEFLAFEIFSSILQRSFPEIEQKLFFQYDHFWNPQDQKKSNKIKGHFVEKLKEYKPDICCYTVFTDTYRIMAEIANDIKIYNPKTVNIFGGIHATLLKDKLLKDNSFIDFVAIGEAEDSFSELISEFVNGTKRWDRISGISYRENGRIISNALCTEPKPLDKIPFPNKDLFTGYLPGLYNAYYIMTGRGCPHNCTYCSSPYLRNLYDPKKYLRRRSVENIIEELSYVRHRSRQIIFMDDVFLHSVEFLKAFLPVYKEKIGLPFFCYTSPLFCDEERLDLLKEAGCRRIGLGVQSGSERIRYSYFKRKGSNEHIARAARLMKSREIKFSSDIILGSPYETREDIKQTLMLLHDIKPDLVQIFYFSYYPGMEITEMSLRDGYISKTDYEMIETGTFQKSYYVGSHFTGKALREMRQVGLMCHLITILPGKLSKWLITKRLYRIFPASFMWHLMCYVISAFRDKSRLYTIFQEILSKVRIGSERRVEHAQEIYRNSNSCRFSSRRFGA